MATRNAVHTDVKVTITDRWISGRRKYVTGTIKVQDPAQADTLTYPENGIPLGSSSTDRGKFGFVRHMDSLEITDYNDNSEALHSEYDKTNHTLRLYYIGQTWGGADAWNELATDDTFGHPTQGAAISFMAIGW